MNGETNTLGFALTFDATARLISTKQSHSDDGFTSQNSLP
jgi:hypothetical protein